eukprot:scaffold40543_cov75-Phaeocystis_antarctica.AAC.1
MRSSSDFTGSASSHWQKLWGQSGTGAPQLCWHHWVSSRMPEKEMHDVASLCERGALGTLSGASPSSARRRGLTPCTSRA